MSVSPFYILRVMTEVPCPHDIAMPGYIRINNQFQLNAKKLMFLKCKKTDMSAFLFCLCLNLAILALFLLKMSLTL